MNKLKLMLLCSIFLIPQLFGLNVQFLDRKININDTDATIFMPPRQIAAMSRDNVIFNARISFEDFQKTKNILLLARQLEEQIITKKENPKTAIDQLAKTFVPEIIPSLLRTNEFLHIRILEEAIRSIPTEQIVPPSPQPEAKNTPQESQSKAEGPYSIEIEGQKFFLNKDFIDSSKTLKTIIEASDTTEDTINIPSINLKTMNLLMPLWRKYIDLSKAEATAKTITEGNKQLTQYLKILKFEQLDSLLGAVNFLDIPYLFNIITTEIAARTLTPEVLNLFQNHPEKFNPNIESSISTSTESSITTIKFNITNEDISKIIINKMLQIPLLYNPKPKFDLISNDIKNLHLMADGRIVTSSFWENTAKIWTINPDNTTSFIKLIRHTKDIYNITLMPDRRIITGSSNGEVIVWTINPDDTTSFIELKGHAGAISNITLMPDGRIITSSIDGETRVWTINSNNTTSFIELINDSAIFSISIMPDKRIVTISNDWKIRIWEINPDNTTSFIDLIDPKDILDFNIMPDGRIVTISADGEAKVWTINSNNTTSFIELISHDRDRISSIAATPDGRIVTGSANGKVKVWTINPNNTTSFIDLIGHGGKITTITLASNSRIITTAEDSTSKIWTISPNDATSFIEFKKPEIKINYITPTGIFKTHYITPNGLIFTCFPDDRIDRRSILSISTINPNKTITSLNLGKFDNLHSVLIDSFGRIFVHYGSKLALLNDPSCPQNLSLEQILFITAYKQHLINLNNPAFRRIFESLNPIIQNDLQRLYSIFIRPNQNTKKLALLKTNNKLKNNKKESHKK